LAGASRLGVVAATGAPRRLAFLSIPNGVNMAHWTPKAEGKIAELPDILKPLEGVKDYVNVISGMTLDKARPNGDGPGDHARAMASFLTGKQARKTHGADIRVGISADQHVANAIGDQTRFPSLELGIEDGKQAGNCDSGYSCAYSSTISWRSEATPVAKEVDPRLVFERVFLDGDPYEAGGDPGRRERGQENILDLLVDGDRA